MENKSYGVVGRKLWRCRKQIAPNWLKDFLDFSSIQFYLGKWYIDNRYLITSLTTWRGTIFWILIFFLHNFHVGQWPCLRRERKGGWFMTEVGEGQGERGVEVVREVESSLFFLHPQVCSSSFPQVFSSSISKVFSLSIPLSFFFLHSPSLLFLRFRSYFSTGFVISPLVEQKKYSVPTATNSLFRV